MGGQIDFLDMLVQFSRSSWGSTFFGWMLGLFSSWFALRRQARMQAETIKTLSDALTAFEDKFKDNLEALSDDEATQLGAAREAFVLSDLEPKGVVRGVAMYPIVSAVIMIASFVAAAKINGGFFILGMFFALGLIATIAGSSELFESVRQTKIEKTANTVRVELQKMRLNSRQYDHLRRWASSHLFNIFPKRLVLQVIEAASLNTRRNGQGAAK